MVKILRLIAVMLVASFSLGAAALDDEGKKMTKAEKRLANVMKKYEYTGKERSCVPLRNLKHQKIIDDKPIHTTKKYAASAT